MKKLLFAAFALTVALSMTAQGHMKFKGIEITGTMSDFEKQIVSQGFLVSSDDYFTKGHDNYKTYKGNFTGEDVPLILQSTVKSHIIYAVSVVYNGEFFWPGLKEQYMDMKKLLSAKYGKPSEVTELFDEGFSEESQPLVAFAEQRAIYRTRFKTSTGGVTLSIVRHILLNYVIVAYWDEQGYNLNETEMLEEL